MRVDCSPMDPSVTGCETPVVSAARGAANPTISSLVTFGVEVAKVTCLGCKVVLSQFIVVLVTAPPLSVFRWFKFTLKPPYRIAIGNFFSAIWDTSHWNFLVKFGLKTA